MVEHASRFHGHIRFFHAEKLKAERNRNPNGSVYLPPYYGGEYRPWVCATSFVDSITGAPVSVWWMLTRKDKAAFKGQRQPIDYRHFGDATPHRYTEESWINDGDSFIILTNDQVRHLSNAPRYPQVKLNHHGWTMIMQYFGERKTEVIKGLGVTRFQLLPQKYRGALLAEHKRYLRQ